MYSVSGGSILAAHLALHWTAYQGNFEGAAASLIEFARSDVRGRVLRRLPKQWLLHTVLALTRLVLRVFRPITRWQPPSWRSPSIELLAAEYGRLIGDVSLEVLAPSEGAPRGDSKGRLVGPVFRLLATDLNTGGYCVLSAAGLEAYSRAYSPGVTYALNFPRQPLGGACGEALPLKVAVAASSAFPPFFSSVRISDADLGSIARLESFPRFLSDGGIFDNMGVQAFLDTEGNSRHVLISNASAAFESSEGPPGLIDRVIRTDDILMHRLALLNRNTLSKSDWLDLPADLAAIRTDLDRFSQDEIRELVRSGYSVACAKMFPPSGEPTELQRLGFKAPARDLTWDPCPDSWTEKWGKRLKRRTSTGLSERATLVTSRQRTIRPFTLLDGESWLHAVIVLLLMLSFSSPMLSWWQNFKAFVGRLSAGEAPRVIAIEAALPAGVSLPRNDLPARRMTGIVTRSAARQADSEATKLDLMAYSNQGWQPWSIDLERGGGRRGDGAALNGEPAVARVFVDNAGNVCRASAYGDVRKVGASGYLEKASDGECVEGAKPGEVKATGEPRFMWPQSVSNRLVYSRVDADKSSVVLVRENRAFSVEALEGLTAGLPKWLQWLKMRTMLIQDQATLGRVAPDLQYLLYVSNENLMARRVDLARLTWEGEPQLVFEDVCVSPQAPAMSFPYSIADAGLTVTLGAPLAERSLLMLVLTSKEKQTSIVDLRDVAKRETWIHTVSSPRVSASGRWLMLRAGDGDLLIELKKGHHLIPRYIDKCANGRWVNDSQLIDSCAKSLGSTGETSEHSLKRLSDDSAFEIVALKDGTNSLMFQNRRKGASENVVSDLQRIGVRGMADRYAYVFGQGSSANFAAFSHAEKEYTLFLVVGPERLRPNECRTVIIPDFRQNLRKLRQESS